MNDRPSAFMEFCREARDVVRTWPKWKQMVLDDPPEPVEEGMEAKADRMFRERKHGRVRPMDEPIVFLCAWKPFIVRGSASAHQKGG